MNPTVKAILKIIAWILGIIILVIAIGVGAIFTMDYLEDRARNNLIIDISLDKEECEDENYPLDIEIVNKSNRYVKSFSFKIEVYRPNHSDSINEFTYYDFDRIIEPLNGVEKCFALPTLEEGYEHSDDHIYMIENKSVTFMDAEKAEKLLSK